jgi:hypothetical protein
MLKILFAATCLAILACEGNDGSSLPAGADTKCDRWEKVLSEDNPDATLYLVEEGCSGFSNGMTVAIEISPRNGRRSTLFKYQDASWNASYSGQTTPTATWIDKDLLRISIGAVDTIDEKLEKAGDVTVEYQVGHVIADEPVRQPQG